MESGYSVKKIWRRYGEFRYKLVLEGICVGLVAGLVVVLFRLALGKLEELPAQIAAYGQAHPLVIPVWFVLLLLAAGGTAALLKWEPMISGSGIPQVDGEMQGYFEQTWWRVLIAKFAGGLLTIGSGLSLGREGPSIQLGAMAGKGLARLTKRMRTEEKILITCGASAGLAAAFNAPLAGVLFSLEEVHKSFSVEVLLSSMAASVTADFLSRNVFGLRPVFDFSGIASIPLSQFWAVLLLGALAGVVGVFYNRCVDFTQRLYDRVKSQYIRTFIPFLLAGALAFLLPQVLGGGSHLVLAVEAGMPFQLLLLLFVVKFIFSMASFGAGVPGGIFLPLLVMGAMCGGIFQGLLGMLGVELNLQAFVILGMVCCFSAIVRAPVTGILLITEMTGSFSRLMFLSMGALAAYAVADLLRARPIYDQLLRRMLFRRRKASFRVQGGEKLLLETPVHLGAPICGKTLGQVDLPTGCLVVSIKRGEEEFVPNGDATVEEGDVLMVLCCESNSRAVNESLEKQCKRTSGKTGRKIPGY